MSIVLLLDLDELFRIDFLRVKAAFEAAIAYLKDDVFDLSHMERWRVCFLAYIARKFLRFLHNYSLTVLLRWKVDQSPVFKEAVNSNDATDISNKISAALSGREMLLHVFSPHTNDEIAVVFVQFAVFAAEGELAALCILLKEFRKGLLFNLMNGVDVEPASKCGDSYMRRWLYDGARDECVGEALRLHTHV